MNFRLRMQLAEALGHVNRWYCSQAHGYPVDDPDLLICYFVRSGGAKDFARRYEEAMGAKNRWYCSEVHGRDICDPQTLWAYYLTNHQTFSIKPSTLNRNSNTTMELCPAR
jgi:hypothetical protein